MSTKEVRATDVAAATVDMKFEIFRYYCYGGTAD
jgi:hypothetical protein